MRPLLPAVVWCVLALVERAAAHALAATDAAGQLLSAGPHTPLAVLVAVPAFLVLRIGLFVALVPTALFTIRRLVTARRARHEGDVSAS